MQRNERVNKLIAMITIFNFVREEPFLSHIPLTLMLCNCFPPRDLAMTLTFPSVLNFILCELRQFFAEMYQFAINIFFFHCIILIQESISQRLCILHVLLGNHAIDFLIFLHDLYLLACHILKLIYYCRLPSFVLVFM